MILDSIVKPKVYFDVNNAKHIKLYRSFVLHKAWGTDCCPFICEFPFLTIPDMIQEKLIYKFLKVKHESRYQ